MKLYCTEIEQNGRKLYFGALRASEIEDMVSRGVLKKDEWAPDNQEGYQRSLTPSRSKSFSKFLKEGGICPENILLNLRTEKPPKFDRIEGTYGVLTVPDGEPDGEIVWIIDGQHRVEGYRIAVSENEGLKDFMVPIVLIHAKNRYQEAEQFYVINQTLKRMRTDLAERFLRRQVEEVGIRVLALQGKEWIPRAIDIADKINVTEGPWYNRVRMPNQPKGTTIISQKSFTDSLEPILKHSLFEDYTIDEITEMLNRYWSAVKDLCPEAFESPQNHVLQKTTGVFVLHKLFPHVVSLCTDENGRIHLATGRIENILSRAQCFTSDYWNSMDGEAARYGTGQKSFRALALDIKERLPVSDEATRANRLIDL